MGACARDACVTSKKSRWGRFYARHRTRRRHSAWYDQRIHDLLTQRNRMQARNTRTMCLTVDGKPAHRTYDGDACSNQHASLSLRYFRVSGLGLHRANQFACTHLSPRVLVWKRSHTLFDCKQVSRLWHAWHDLSTNVDLPGFHSSM